MTRLFERGLGPIAALALVLSLGVAWVTRRFRFPPLLAWATSMLAMVWFVSVRFFADTLAGPFPSGETMTQIGRAIRTGATLIAEEIAPVDPSPPLLLYIAAGVWLTAWLAHMAITTLGNPLLGVASTIGLFILPGAIVPTNRLWLEGALYIAAAGIVLFLDHRARLARWGPAGSENPPGWHAAPALRLGLVGVALVALIAPALPGFGAPPVIGGGLGSGRVHFNPIVSIKPTLDDDRNIELFRVEASRPTYYRLTALEVFDGTLWQPRRDRDVRDFYEPTIDVDTTEPVRQEITITALAGPWLPAAYQARSVFGDDADVEPDTWTLLADDRLRPGLRYTVESRVPTPSVELLDRPIDYARVPGTPAGSLDLPRGIPREVREFAEDITRDAETPYQQALALQRELRSFRYDENIAEGHSFDDMVTFLTDVRAGYCEQFASAMAVMARLLGIPARVVIGFGIGEQIDDGVWRVTTRQAHAWVEVFFPQAGWVLFEPTPRATVTQLPDYAPGQQARNPGPEATDEPTSRPTEDPAARQPGDNSPLVDVPGDQPAGAGSTGFGVLVGVLLLIAVGAPLAYVNIRRRARLRAARTPRALVAAHYADFLEWCAAVGLPRALAETPREHAARIRPRARSAGDALDVLTIAVEEALWAPPNGLDPADAQRAASDVRDALRPTLTRPARILAALRWGAWRQAR